MITLGLGLSQLLRVRIQYPIYACPILSQVESVGRFPNFRQCDPISLSSWLCSFISSFSLAMLNSNLLSPLAILAYSSPLSPSCQRNIQVAAFPPFGIVHARRRGGEGVEVNFHAKGRRGRMRKRDECGEEMDLRPPKASWSVEGGKLSETTADLREDAPGDRHDVNGQSAAGVFRPGWRNDFVMGQRENWEYWRRGRNWRGGRRSGLGPHRSWFSLEDEVPASIEKILLVSYNILADKNAAEHYRNLYYHIPWEHMRWERRKRKMVAELEILSPDIMCLQEVDKFEELQQEFERLGYHGAYAARTGGALDGCAMFWKRSRLALLEERSIMFNEFALKDNVAQLCVFQIIGERTLGSSSSVQTSELRQSDRKPTARVIVGNIHVLFNPKRGDIKLGQVRVLLESAHTLSKQWGGAPLAIAGDFNSTPKSDLYKFLATSELDLSGIDRTTMSGQVEGDISASEPWTLQAKGNSSGEKVDFEVKRAWNWTEQELLAATGRVDCLSIHHALRLRSAYPQIKGAVGSRDENGEPLVTTFHRRFMGTVDYIWYTEGLQALKVLETVPVNALRRWLGLPTQEWGSDHLAIACEFAVFTINQGGDS